MKKLSLILALALSGTLCAQLQSPPPNGGLGGIPPLSNAQGLEDNAIGNNITTNIDINKIDGWASIDDFDTILLAKAGTDGSVYLFDEWENRGVIEVDDKRYIFSNMNYNVKRSAFQSKIGQDSVVSFDLSTFDRIVINDKAFKSIYNPSKRANENFEVIYEGSDMAILKGYVIEITEANPNPMINRSKRKILTKERYYVKKKNSIKSMKFKKKGILALAGDKSADLERYAKKNKLSFKDESDVRRMLTNVLND